MSKFAPHHKSTNNPRATPSTICQRCLGRGHFIHQCKLKAAPYVTRPSRTQLLENPSLRKKKDGPSVEVPEEFKNKAGVANKILEAKEKARDQAQEEEKPPKRKRSTSRSSSSSSSSDSSSSDSDSDSGSGSHQSRRSRSPRTKKQRVHSRSRHDTSSSDDHDRNLGKGRDEDSD